MQFINFQIILWETIGFLQLATIFLMCFVTIVYPIVGENMVRLNLGAPSAVILKHTLKLELNIYIKYLDSCCNELQTVNL